MGRDGRDGVNARRRGPLHKDHHFNKTPVRVVERLQRELVLRRLNLFLSPRDGLDDLVPAVLNPARRSGLIPLESQSYGPAWAEHEARYAKSLSHTPQLRQGQQRVLGSGERSHQSFPVQDRLGQPLPPVRLASWCDGRCVHDAKQVSA